MIRSPYETQYTRELREGKKNPSVSTKNGVSEGKAKRKRDWEIRKSNEGKQK